MRFMQNKFLAVKLIIALTFLTATGCRKIVQVKEPIDTLTTSEVFSNEANATAALAQVYNHLITNGGTDIGILMDVQTLFAGLSSDELNTNVSDQSILQFQSNMLESQNSRIYGFLWFPAYKGIYFANAVIEGIAPAENISDSVKKQLTAEAKFLACVY